MLDTHLRLLQRNIGADCTLFCKAEIQVSCASTVEDDSYKIARSKCIVCACNVEGIERTAVYGYRLIAVALSGIRRGGKVNKTAVFGINLEVFAESNV